MRTLFFIFSLAISQLYAQNLKMPIPVGSFQPKLAFSNYKSIQFTSPNFSFKTYITPYSLNIYNPASGLNDTFYLKNQEAKYSKSFYIAQNALHARGTKIDSFNPYGTNNIGAALALGVIDLLLNK
ncbi:hypothetical protein [Flavobacterium succinicans]|uniref:DUF5723 domain-containing protein n=1 Tax=Flavobacterium succinicans TaxID=29536 RepID=A0A199XT16_9FLAO|nr:hypothetical protein [Flavobacterium succinicans]OAZ04785.1 hypothetical protein FLB_06330 [Flavobacterium succinicans]